jgi:ATP-dependent Clp protease ATP-binding subunit ClpC
MSEYMEKHAVSRLVGSPPGYVGYDEGGQLTEAVRRKPYCVLLLDEIEKAHPDVFNILLQILEDGRLTDSQGRTVDFRNAIVIMTSNVGAQDIARNTPLGFAVNDEMGTTYDEMKKKIMGDLKKVFRPEFLNRIDEVIVFHKLDRGQIREIVDLLVGRVKAQVSEHELQLDLEDEAKDLLVDKGWDPSMGARPLRRAIQRYIEDPLADEVLKAGPDNIEPGTTVLVQRHEKGDDEDQPLKLKLIKPKKKRPPKKKREDEKKEPVGVGAKASKPDPEIGAGDGPAAGGAPATEAD